MTPNDIASLMKGIAPALRDMVAGAVQPLLERITTLEAELAEVHSVDHADLVRDLVADAVGKLPPAAAGKDADPEITAVLVREEVERAIAALPAPQDGKSVTVEDVAPLIEDAVSAAILDAVAAIPAPEPGKDGAPGMLPIVKAWEDRVYYQGEVALFDGATYQAGKDTGRAPPHEDWTCIAARGHDGKDADEIEVKSTYSEGETYKRLNIVALNGAAFIARKDDPGPCPGEGWQVIAMRGKPGAPGEGKKGDPGIRGLPGPAVAALDVDDNGLLMLRNADGTEIACDLYPLLAKVR